MLPVLRVAPSNIDFDQDVVRPEFRGRYGYFLELGLEILVVIVENEQVLHIKNAFDCKVDELQLLSIGVVEGIRLDAIDGHLVKSRNAR